MIRKCSTLNFCFVKNSNHMYIYTIYRMLHFQYFCRFCWLQVLLSFCGHSYMSCYSPATRAVCQVPKKVVQEVEQPVYRPVPHMAGGPGVSPREFHRRSFTGQTFCQVKQHVEREIPVPKPYLQTLEVVQQVGGVSHWQFSTFMLSVTHESLPCVVKPILSQTL